MVLSGSGPLVSMDTSSDVWICLELMYDNILSLSFYYQSDTHHALFHPSFAIISELGRDVVSYAMSYFDRIVPHYGINDTLVQLVAMTCLYLAIKVHCSKKISVQSMVSLSRGSFRDDQVLKMERIVLQGLNWYLTPATPHLFLEIFFETSQDNEAMNEIKDSASYLLELAVCDNFFITKKASSISRAAILAAMDIVARPLEVNVLLENLLVDDDRCVVEKCYTRLLQIYNMIVKQDADGVPQEVIAEREVSPTSVFSVA